MATTSNRPADVELTCKACGTPFVWTTGEQAFFREKNFQQPRRCRPCRTTKRAANGGTDAVLR